VRAAELFGRERWQRRPVLPNCSFGRLDRKGELLELVGRGAILFEMVRQQLIDVCRQRTQCAIDQQPFQGLSVQRHCVISLK
jgi:hypothetical protein